MRILFAWDFHGVLEKDNELAVLEIANKILEKYNLSKKITLAEVLAWYGLSWFDYFRNAYPGGNSDVWEAMHQEAIKIQKEQEIVEKYIKPRDDAEKVLKLIKNKNHSNIIITNTNPMAVKYFVDLVELTSYVDNMIGVDLHHLSRDNEIHEIKGNVLRSFLKNNHFDKVVVIGDRESDIKAGKMIGAVTYLFVGSRTFNNPDLTEKAKPDYIITDLGKVLNELNFRAVA